jgi:hypothetical protein
MPLIQLKQVFAKVCSLAFTAITTLDDSVNQEDSLVLLEQTFAISFA